MTVLNELYDYGLKIYQNKDYFKFSLDSILLAEFVRFKKNDRVLDMCTGNAPIPLILATKSSTLNIDAIELQEEIYDLACKSVKINKLDDRISIRKGDVKTVDIEFKYDIVTCNPPYFKVSETSKVNLNKIKSIARHEMFITLEDVVHMANLILKENGIFYMVHKTDRLLETIELCKKERLGIRQIVFIMTKSNKQSEFFLIEASKYKKDDLKVYSISVAEKKTFKGIFKEELI